VFGLFFMLIATNRRKEIELIRPLRLPSSGQDWQSFSVQLVKMLSLILFIVLVSGLGIGLGQKGRDGLALWLAGMLPLYLAMGLIVGIAKGLKAVAGPINETVHPQQRLNEAIRSSLLLFPFLILAGMTVFVQVLFLAEQQGIAVGPFFHMRFFYVVLVGTALLSFFSLCTNMVLQHYLLRLCLRLEGQLPFRLVPWLEAMHQRKILQQVGGNYHFLHKQLQEYLAKSQIG